MDGMKDEPANNLYERDFYTWTQEQAELLKSKRFDKVDLANVSEEIETLGRSELSSSGRPTSSSRCIFSSS